MALLANKTAIISGGARGIGEAIVRAFVQEGAKVVFTYFQSHEKAQALEVELGSEHVKAIYCDGSNAEDVKRCIKESLVFLGKIDILVNNAGITKDGILLRMSEKDFDEVIQTNLKSVFLFSKATLKSMLKNGGSIINISSVMGIYGNAGQANYSASKAGIIGLTKAIAKEYGVRKIRCNAIAPGWIQTDMTKNLSDTVKSEFDGKTCLNRMGEPNEVAQVAVFLASEMSSYITGQVIQVCGGLQ
ncbi:MAG: SDR family oxidoreductase [Chitinophagales bacterium]|nr:SDR family oxidoreductase [Chitinophagales bacterium]